MKFKNVFRSLFFVSLTLVFASAFYSENKNFYQENNTEYQSYSYSNQDTFSLPHKVTASNNFKKASYQKNQQSEEIKITPPFIFTGAVIKWEEFIPSHTEAYIEYRLLEKDNWTAWKKLESDSDHQDHEHEDEVDYHEEENYTSALLNENKFEEKDTLIFSKGAQHLAYRVILSSEEEFLSPQIQNIKIEFLDNKVKNPVVKKQNLAALAFNDNSLKIISREEWGANETFGYKSYFENKQLPQTPISNGKSNLPPSEAVVIKTVSKDPLNDEDYLWPLEYPDRVKKIFIHHTATNTDLDNPVTAIRNIYHYHSVSRAWGDIGYNYIIDSYGNIYEGRKGGASVVAGHANGYNRGSVGIALLGDFENSQPTYEMMASLIKLTKNLTDTYNIDPEGASIFNETVMPNIAGHYEVSATRCPGSNISAMLPAVRKITAKIGKQIAQSSFTNNTFSGAYNYSLAQEYEPLYLESDVEKILEFKFKNTGSKPWGAETFLVVNQNAATEGSVYFPEKFTFSKQKELTVNPGEIGTFALKIKSGLKPDLLAFDLTLVFDGKYKSDNYFTLPVYVNAPKMEFTQQSYSYLESSYKEGDLINLEYKVTNTGAQSWSNSGANAVKLTFANPLFKESSLVTEGKTLEAYPQEGFIAPGSTATFKFSLKASGNEGAIYEELTLFNDNYGRLEGELTPISFYLGNTPKLTAQLISIKPEKAFAPGETRIIEFKMRNTGSQTWTRIGENTVQVVSVHKPSIKAASPFGFNEGKVAPGETATFNLAVTAPIETGEQVILFTPWFKGVKLLNKPIYYYFDVYNNGGENNELLPDLNAQNQTTDNKPIKIKLGFNKDEAQVTSSANFKVYDGDREVFQLFYGEILNVKKFNQKILVGHNNIELSVNGPVKIVPQTGGIVELKNYENRPAWNTSLNDNRFRGEIEFWNLDNNLIAINSILLEDYLKGIGEVSNGDPLEKIKTIVVLARTYAKFYRDVDQKFPGKPYNLDDNPDISQKYLGFGLEERSPNLVKAVNATKGQIVTYEGQLIKTPYFNTSDGRTRSAKEVWGWTHTPYLQSVPDPLCNAGKLNGHGVGLSGCGATEAAKIGKTYEEIIKYYYQGVEITK